MAPFGQESMFLQGFIRDFGILRPFGLAGRPAWRPAGRPAGPNGQNVFFVRGFGRFPELRSPGLFLGGSKIFFCSDKKKGLRCAGSAVVRTSSIGRGESCAL